MGYSIVIKEMWAPAGKSLMESLFVESFLECSLFSHYNKAISDDYGSVVGT